MSKSRLVLTDPAEAAVVEQIQVRLVRLEEEARWDELMSQHHYLKSARMVGEQLRYVAEYQGQWLALLGWSAAAYHLKGRDSWIGWNYSQRRGRLHLVANNARFCRLGEPIGVNFRRVELVHRRVGRRERLSKPAGASA